MFLFLGTIFKANVMFEIGPIHFNFIIFTFLFIIFMFLFTIFMFLFFTTFLINPKIVHFLKGDDCSPSSPTAGGKPRGVGFVRFDRRVEAQKAIDDLNDTIPEGGTEKLTVKFANNPSQNIQKALQQVYMNCLSPGAARPGAGGRQYPPGPVRHATPCIR